MKTLRRDEIFYSPLPHPPASPASAIYTPHPPPPYCLVQLRTDSVLRQNIMFCNTNHLQFHLFQIIDIKQKTKLS